VDWLRVHPIVVPHPSPTSIMDMAKLAGITFTESLSAPPNTRLLLPPTPRLPSYASADGNPFLEWGSAPSQPGPLAGNGKVLNPYKEESSWMEAEVEEGGRRRRVRNGRMRTRKWRRTLWPRGWGQHAMSQTEAESEPRIRRRTAGPKEPRNGDGRMAGRTA
jgi:hypothetical protein